MATFDVDRWMSGLSRTPGKRVWVNSPPRVRIPPCPPISDKRPNFSVFFYAQNFRKPLKNKGSKKNSIADRLRPSQPSAPLKGTLKGT